VRRFRDLSFRRKVSLGILLIGNTAALLACVVFGAFDRLTVREGMERDLTTLADVLGNNSTAALVFQDPKNAVEILGALQVKPNIAAAGLYDKDAQVFAAYTRPGAAEEAPRVAGPDGVRFEADRLVLTRPVVLDNKRVGAILLRSDLSELRERLHVFAFIVAVALTISVLATGVLAAVFQRALSRPILTLSRTALQISEDKKYSVRVAKQGEDEIGELTDGFNQMLAAIEERDTALRRTNVVLQAEIGVRRHVEDELRALNETLEQRVTERTAAAEQASRAKSEFLANMSHELRTPLNSVIGFANLLLKNRRSLLDAEDRSFLERIVDNGKNLLSLINQVLDLSKVEAGKLELHLGPVDVAALVRQLAAEFDSQLAGKDLDLLTDLPEEIALLASDSDKLRQILVNLIGNAIKFTARGRVTLRIVTDPATSRPVRLEVEDTGIGIPAEKQQLIFEAFQQADSTTARIYGGTGLGLSISLALCKLLGYRLTVHSVVGGGSTFSIILAQGED
jgi:signal transduction histidine kinase